ncbi:MAG: hypothetical protein EOP62_08535, partial [Sphingomonadales bacterium]
MTQDRLFRMVALAAILALPATIVTVAHAAPQGATKSATRKIVSAPVARISDYSWIDRADALWEAIGDAPPDFTFSYQNLEPWAWQTADGHQIIVEDAGEQGGIRSYYFAPGALNPFLVVEPGASFGFTGTKVAMVYGPDGGVIAKVKWATRPARGQMLFARAKLLKRALERERRGIDPYTWNDSSEPILTFLLQWDLGHTRYAGWRTYRGSREGVERRRRLDGERERRRGEARDFERWQRGNMQGPPQQGFDPRRGPRPGRPGQPGASGPQRPPMGAGWQRTPRPVREPVDPALFEPMVPGALPARPPGVNRPARPAIEDRTPVAPQPVPGAGRPDRPDRGEGRPPRVQPVNPVPQPVESRPSRPAEAQPPALPIPNANPPVARPDRPDRGEGRPPRVQPVEPVPQPVEVRPQPAPPVERVDPPVSRPDRPDRGEGRPPRVQPVDPVPQPVEVRPEPVAPAPAPQPEAPVERQRPAKLDWVQSPSRQIERPDVPVQVEQVPVEVAPPPPPP